MPFGNLGYIYGRKTIWDSDVDFNKGTLDAELEVSGTGDASQLQLKSKIDEDNDIDYATAGEYTLSDSSKLEISSGFARLKALTGASIDWPLTTSSNYTYDSAKINISSGIAKLVDLRKTNATFYSDYSSKDGNWGNGVLTGTLNNSATVTGGELDVSGGSGKSVDYAYLNNADVLQIGCARFGYIPQYTGIPSDYQVMFTIGNNGDFDDSTYIYHAISTGKIYLAMYDASKNLIMAQDLGAWSPTAGTEYEFEFNWDITNGATRLFIDGNQVGTTGTQIGIHTAQTDIRIGNNYANTLSSNFKINYFLLFSTIQHTSNYTPAGQGGISSTIYTTTNPTIISNTGFAFIVNLNSFIETSTTPSGSSIKYHISADNGTTWKYWNGSAWAVTDGSFTQSNTSAVISTNISTLASSGTLKFRALLNSNGNANPQLDNIYSGEPITYSTTDNLYIDTNDSSKISPVNIILWISSVISNSTPANTDIKLMYSVDGRSSWLTWNGSSSWITPNNATIRADATSILDAAMSFSSLPVGSGTLDVRLFLYTSDNTVYPSVSNINIISDSGFELSGTWESNSYNSGYRNMNWGQIEWDETTPSGTTIVHKVKAANSITELTAASYTTVASNGDDAGVTGQYIQFKTEFSGTSILRPSLDEILVNWNLPSTTQISP